MTGFATGYWEALPALAQDVIWFAVLLLPALVTGLVVTRGYRPFGLVRAMMWRYRWTNALFVALIAVSVVLAVGATLASEWLGRRWMAAEG